MKKIFSALAICFPNLDVDRLSTGSRFADVPGWDSMSSVSFQMELEAQLGGVQLDLVVVGEQTLQSLAEELAARGYSAN